MHARLEGGQQRRLLSPHPIVPVAVSPRSTVGSSGVRDSECVCRHSVQQT